MLTAFSFAQESWNTNLLDYSFNKNAKKMIFREPITFTPFELKTGFFHYGGNDYLRDFSILLVINLILVTSLSKFKVSFFSFL